MSKKLSVAVTLVLSIIIGASAARAAEIKLLTTGAFKPEVLALVPDFEKQTCACRKSNPDVLMM
jgi:hypothetical protein